MNITKSAYESLIEYEGDALVNIAKLLSGNTQQARETLERILDHALKQLYVAE
jgi:hypothetical protein